MQPVVPAVTEQAVIKLQKLEDDAVSGQAADKGSADIRPYFVHVKT